MGVHPLDGTDFAVLWFVMLGKARTACRSAPSGAIPPISPGALATARDDVSVRTAWPEPAIQSTQKIPASEMVFMASSCLDPGRNRPPGRTRAVAAPRVTPLVGNSTPRPGARGLPTMAGAAAGRRQEVSRDGRACGARCDRDLFRPFRGGPGPSRRGRLAARGAGGDPSLGRRERRGRRSSSSSTGASRSPASGTASSSRSRSRDAVRRSGSGRSCTRRSTRPRRAR